MSSGSTGAGSSRGTGFLVAPGEVLTCAHVVHDGRPTTVATASGTVHDAEPITELLAPDDPAATFYPQPDAAVLRLVDPPDGHPCVRLEAADPALGDPLQITAYTMGEYTPDEVERSGATLHLETLFEMEGSRIYKLREGQVIGGFSGGPLLNLRTGGVCAVIDSSRPASTDLGGFGVPVAAITALACSTAMPRSTPPTCAGATLSRPSASSMPTAARCRCSPRSST